MQPDKKQLENQEHNIILWLYRIEDFVVTILLSSILLLSITQIILRNFYDSGFIWADSLIRILVLWLGLSGAILASRHGKQINIDVLSQFIPAQYKHYIFKFNNFFAATICLIISYYSFLFVSLEYQDGIYAFEKVPAWVAEAIIPFGFLIMGIKYLVQIRFSNYKNKTSL